MKSQVSTRLIDARVPPVSGKGAAPLRRAELVEFRGVEGIS
jgi:hypothetical protein